MALRADMTAFDSEVAVIDLVHPPECLFEISEVPPNLTAGAYLCTIDKLSVVLVAALLLGEHLPLTSWHRSDCRRFRDYQ